MTLIHWHRDQCLGADQVSQADDCMNLLQRGETAPNPTLYKAGTVERWTATAAAHLGIYCRLVVEPNSRTTLTQVVADSNLNASVKGKQGRSVVAVHFDMNLCGEAATRPWQRVPVPTEDLVKKLCLGALAARNAEKDETGEVVKPADCDIVLINQGAVDAKLAQIFPRAPGVYKKELVVVLSQESVAERTKKWKGDVKQTQTFRISSAQPLKRLMPEVQFQTVTGSNRGHAMAWISLKPVRDLWTEPVSTKLAIFEPKMFGAAFGSDKAPGLEYNNNS